MADLVLTIDNDLISDSEQRVLYNTVLTAGLKIPDITVMLPTVVSGGAGAAVDFDHDIEFQCNVDARMEIVQKDTGQLVHRLGPFDSVILRSTGSLDGEAAWIVSDLMLEIIATAEHATVADFDVTDPVALDATGDLSTADTYAAATIDTELDQELDAAIDQFETQAATAFALFETNSVHILHAMRTANIIET